MTETKSALPSWRAHRIWRLRLRLAGWKRLYGPEPTADARAAIARAAHADRARVRAFGWQLSEDGQAYTEAWAPGGQIRQFAAVVAWYFVWMVTTWLTVGAEPQGWHVLIGWVVPYAAARLTVRALGQGD